MQLYVLDRAKNTLATTSSFYSDKHHKELTAGASIFEFTIDKSDAAAQYMTTGNYLVFKDDRGRAWSFTILSYDETQTTKTVAAEDVSIELLNKAMDVWNTDQAYPFSYYFDLVTKDTPWTLGVNQLTDLSRKLVYTGRDTGLGRLLSVLKGFDNAECQFNIKVQQNKPVEFIVDVYKSIGTVQDNIQIVYNNELADIKKTESRAQFVTALAGIGGLVENQATTDPGLEKHIDFTDIDYKDDNFVSPKGDKFLRAVTANKTFNPGTTTYIEDFYDYDTQSAQELLNRTLTQLKERSEPQYTYDADVKIIDPTLDIGDTVTIIDHDYNPALYLQARVATLDKSYTDSTQGAITFCNYRVLNSNLSDQLRAMQNIIDQLPTSASIKVINNNIVQMIADNTELKKQVTFALKSADGKNVNYYGPDKPIQPNVGDIWFTQNGDKQVMMIYRDGQWHELASDMTGEEIKSKVDEAFANDEALQKRVEDNDTKIADNITKTDAAVDAANQAVSQAGFANDAADQAKSAAANAQADAANALSGTSLAQQDATKALASAQAALTSVTAANDTANRADSSASAAQASAQAAIKSAQTALSMASGADAKAEATAKVATTADSNATDALSGANIALDSATTALNQARSAGSAATSTAIIAKSNQSAISTLATKASVNTLTSQVASTATLQKQTADELLSKADSSVVDSLTSTANSTSTLATQTATALKSKAEISTVNTVNSTATSAATLATQTATTLKSKADSTTVDKLTGRVSSAESKLTQTATKAELALTQNDIDDLGDTVSNQGVKLAATATAAELAATQDNVDTLKKTVTNNTAGVTANAKQIALKANQTDVDTLKGTVTSQGAQVAVTASQVALKADTATVNNLGKTVASQGAQLSLTATEVDLEAAQSAVDAVTKTVTSNTAGMTANANALKLKADSSTVSDLDGRVTSLSGQLDVQSDLISAKVTASDVTGMLGNYATQSWSQGQISAAKNEISASVETVRQTVDNMALGGRNYFSVSGFAANKYAFAGIDFYDFAGIDFYDLQLLPNTKYTVSTTNVGIPAQGYANVFVDNKGFTPDSGGNGVIVNKPRTVTTDSTGILTIAARNYSLADGKDKIQVELGAVATLWQPAPEDMASQDWTKSLLDVSEGKVTAQVQSVKTDLTNTLNNNITNATAGMATQTWVNNKVSLTEDGLTADIQKLRTDTTDNIANATAGMATQTWTQSKLDLTAESFKTQISSVQTNLDNMQIGGRNLIHDTSFDRGMWHNIWNKPTMSITSDGNLKFTIPDTNQAGVGVTAESLAMGIYTLTAKVRGHGQLQPYVMYRDIGNYGLYDSNYPMINSDTDFVDIKYTFTLKGKDPAKQYAFAILTNYAVGNWLEIKKDSLKLESGNVATAWTAALEDMATAVQFTSLEQTLNGFQTTVNNAATQTQVSQLAGQITSVVKDVAPIKNLFPDPTFEGGWLPTAEGTGWTVKYDNNNLWILNSGGAVQRVYWPGFGHVGGSYSVKMLYNSAIGGPIRVGFKPVNDADMGTQYSFSAVDSGTHWVEFTVNCTVNTAFCIWLQNAQPFRVHELYIFNSATGVATSQITQLQSDINLRVKTGDYASAMLNINNMIEAKVDNDDFTGALLSINNAIDLQVYNAKNGNLLRNSEFITDKYWTQTGNHSFWPFEPKESSIGVPSMWVNTTGAGAKTGGRLTTEFKADGLTKYDKVTLSFYAQGTAGTQLTFTLNGTTLDTYAVTLTATRTYYTLSPVYDTGNKLSIFADRADNAILVDSLMLVKGDTAMPWEPAGDNILTRIYMDDSDVLIQGKHIHLDGETTIDVAIIKSAMIDTVSANKLTAGTIDANEINVIHINGQNITANSITGDKLSADAIQVGLNNLGSVIQINPTSLDFYNGGQRSMSLQKDGMHIIDYLNGEDVGMIHVNRIVGHDNVNGLQFDLNKNGDYMGWGQRSDDTSLYDIKLGWFSSYGASQADYNPGFNFEDYVTFNNLIKMNADQGLRFTNINYNNSHYASLTSDNREVGILFGTTELYFMRNNHVISLADILSKLGYVI